MSEQPVIVDKKPIGIDIEKGKTYAWCSCGKSSKQPFCDGSHKTTAFSPVQFTAEETGTVYLCGCKRTAGKPHCDGTHKTL